jgi:hypothetical protein
VAHSTDGGIWTVSESLKIAGADPGAVTLSLGGWVVVATGPPRPGTPSEQRRRAEPNFSLPAQLPSSVKPLNPGSDGPWNHRVLLAASVDGFSWRITDELNLQQASVPELFEGPSGRPILLFVDASGLIDPGQLGAMEKQQDDSWIRKHTNLRGADPNVVLLPDGIYRAYTKEINGSMAVFTMRL